MNAASATILGTSFVALICWIACDVRNRKDLAKPEHGKESRMLNDLTIHSVVFEEAHRILADTFGEMAADFRVGVSHNSETGRWQISLDHDRLSHSFTFRTSEWQELTAILAVSWVPWIQRHSALTGKAK